MKNINNGKQMKNFWIFKAPNKNDTEYGKHPTQRPYKPLDRII